jgi:hypothetical protein
MTRTEATPAVAHNKAAQAVAAWRAGLRFTTVSINPENGRDWPARLHHDKAPKWFQPQLDSGDRTRLLAERRILVSFAGQIAKEKFLGLQPRFDLQKHDGRIVDLAMLCCSSVQSSEAFLRSLYGASRDLVDRESDWQAIEAIANALLQHETLGYADVLKVITSGPTSTVPNRHGSRLRNGKAPARLM